MLFVLAPASYLPLILCDNMGKAEAFVLPICTLLSHGGGATSPWLQFCVGYLPSASCSRVNMLIRTYGAPVIRFKLCARIQLLYVKLSMPSACLNIAGSGTAIPLHFPSSDPERPTPQKPARGGFPTVTMMIPNPSEERPCSIILTVDYFSDAYSVLR